MCMRVCTDLRLCLRAYTEVNYYVHVIVLDTAIIPVTILFLSFFAFEFVRLTSLHGHAGQNLRTSTFFLDSQKDHF